MCLWVRSQRLSRWLLVNPFYCVRGQCLNQWLLVVSLPLCARMRVYVRIDRTGLRNCFEHRESVCFYFYMRKEIQYHISQRGVKFWIQGFHWLENNSTLAREKDFLEWWRELLLLISKWSINNTCQVYTYVRKYFGSICPCNDCLSNQPSGGIFIGWKYI